MNLSPLPFSKIKDGKKDIEMRVLTNERRKIKIGDTIIFTHKDTKEELITEVISLKTFPSFKELYEYYPKERIGYENNEIASYEDMYLYYSKEQIDENGVIAIGIKLKK